MYICPDIDHVPSYYGMAKLTNYRVIAYKVALAMLGRPLECQDRGAASFAMKGAEHHTLPRCCLMRIRDDWLGEAAAEHLDARGVGWACTVV